MGTPDPISSIVLFDGVCNLCNRSVQFIIRRDPHAKFRYAALQSETGQQVLTSFGVSLNSFHSIILIQNGKFLERSSAALEIARRLTGFWPLLYAFKIVPHFIRDPLYNFIANNRYRFFGKLDHCMIPTPELKSRFI